MTAIPTVKVSDGQGSYMVINTTDFDRDRHVLFEESPPYGEADADGDEDSGEDMVAPLPPEFAIATRAQYLKEHNTVTALRQMAKAWEVAGRSSMNEDALATAIAEAEAAASAGRAASEGEAAQN
jgi:hypothetical protein